MILSRPKSLSLLLLLLGVVNLLRLPVQALSQFDIAASLTGLMRWTLGGLYIFEGEGVAAAAQVCPLRVLHKPKDPASGVSCVAPIRTLTQTQKSHVLNLPSSSDLTERGECLALAIWGVPRGAGVETGRGHSASLVKRHWLVVAPPALRKGPLLWATFAMVCHGSEPVNPPSPPRTLLLLSLKRFLQLCGAWGVS
eukprot:6475523-Amphidinium_carterae.1